MLYQKGNGMIGVIMFALTALVIFFAGILFDIFEEDYYDDGSES